MKILLVDDVDFFIELERDFLKRTPAEILIARDGVQALELMRREQPNLVYLDVDMPGMDGLSCCQEIKKDPYLRPIPVILLFSAQHQANEQLCADAGAESYLTKPLERVPFLEAGHYHLFSAAHREKRYPCQFPVDFSLDGEPQTGTICDISSGGVYIQSRQHVDVHTKIAASFHLPVTGRAEITAKGRVAWVNQGFPRKDLHLPQGFGVQFQLMTKETRDVVRSYIAAQEQDGPVN